MKSITTGPAATLNRAVEASNNADFLEAERLCHSILTASPDLYEALRLLADVQANLGRSNDALATYERVLSVHTDDAVVWNNRGVMLQARKRFDEALASYERAIALKPDFADALYNRGLTLQAATRFQDALGSYDHALSVRPTHATALTNRGFILRELGWLQKALGSYE